MTPLEQLHRDLGSPSWFWPAVMLVMFLLFSVAGGFIDG